MGGFFYILLTVMDKTLLYLLALNVLLFFLRKLTRKKKFWGAAFSFLFSTLVTLSVVELVYRFFIRKTTVTESGNYGGSINQLNSTYGYTVKNIPSISHIKVLKSGDTVFNCHYSIIPDSGINKQDINHRVGYRPEQAAGDSELVFLGCSFTFGSGIDDTATLPYLAGKFGNIPSVNMGGSGWGTHHVYQLFTHKYTNIPDNKKRVFIYSFIPDHVVRAKSIYSWSLNDPYFRAQGDSLQLEGSAYKHSGYARWHVITRVLSLNRMLSFISDLGNIFITMSASKNINEEDYKRVQLMMENINASVKSRGDRFIIVHWNDYKGLTPKDEPFVKKDKMAAILSQLQAHGAEIVNISDVVDMNDPANTITNDNHPNKNANALIARKLVQLVRP
jgi:hypothetical protein